MSTAYEEWEETGLAQEEYDSLLEDGGISPANGPVVCGPGGFPLPMTFDEWLSTRQADDKFAVWFENEMESAAEARAEAYHEDTGRYYR